jgi:D-alanyl-D-alanine carboxypeptidase
VHLIRRLALGAFCLISSLLLVSASEAGPKLLVDMQTGDVLYAEDAGAPWHPASLTKLMTAYVAFEALAEGKITLDSIVTMSANAETQAPAVSGLRVGDTLTLKDALYVLLVKSANDMAVAVGETVAGSTDAYVAQMNATAQKLGLVRTHYDNVNGLPDEGQVTTARDLAVLAIDLRRTFPQYDDIFRTRIVTLNKANLRSDNAMLNSFAGTDGMKTGFVCGSGFNLVATVNRSGRQLLAVVLGGSSGRERDQMAAQMLLRGFSGELKDGGKSVVDLVDDTTSPPTDMTPLICGKQARAYISAQIKAFPLGLHGQPSYLTDKIVSNVYQATNLGPVGGPAVADASAAGQLAQGDGDAAPPVAVTPVTKKPVAPPAPHRRTAHAHHTPRGTCAQTASHPSTSKCPK